MAERGAEPDEELDVLVVGAGLSGVGAGYWLKTKRPADRWLILEARGRMGGTWDLFRYPGVRSDSDMHTLGFSFRPWTSEKALADGPTILGYIEDTARACGVDEHVRFHTRVTSAAWDSRIARWTVQAETSEGPRTFRCRFLYLCAGYYDYSGGHAPTWPGMETFRGRIVHPQAWPEDLDWSDQRVAVIGSGATAVTLVPALAERAAHVAMVQRSPTYVVSRPNRDGLAQWLHRRLPGRLAHGIIRWRNVLLQMYFYGLARRRPGWTRERILADVRRRLGDGYDVDTHFGPTYDPWDQRLCLVPDADLFEAIRAGRASIVTGDIARFTPNGLEMTDGRTVAADLVVTATGLVVRMAGGVALSVDGKPVSLPERLVYKGMMLEGVPNLAFALGYTNASWTLKCELTSRFVCRLRDHMDRRGLDWCAPSERAPGVAEQPALNLSSGYIRRAEAVMPKQGDRKPWRVNQNYALDVLELGLGRVDDGGLRFGKARG